MKLALQNPHILHECHAINTMLKYIVDLEQDELRESVLYTLLHAVDRFTINDNSEPTIVDSADPNGPAYVLVDEGMRERHELIGNMFSVRFSFQPKTKFFINLRNLFFFHVAISSNFFFMRKRDCEIDGSSWNVTSTV